jgi:hypothetical protein
VSSHPELGDDDRMLLLMDEDPGVRRRALRYLPETQEWVERLMQTDDADLIAWAVERRGGEGGAGALAEAADGLGDPRRAVREAWLRKVAAVPEMMRFFDRDASRFVTDDSPLVRRSLAICARDGGVLATLALDEVDSVREAALGNLGTPAAVLIEEAERLCAAPPERWGTTDPEYLFHIQAVEALLKHPRLPAAALSAIHRVFPLSYRLEPHRNMDAAVILERAMSLTPSLGLDARFLEWVEAAGAGTPSPTLWTTWLSCDDGYLRAAARLNPATPLEILLRQARRMSATELEGVALHPMLSFKTPAGASLLQLLMNQDDERVAVALASNPDAPLRVLREVAWKSATAKERAGLTAWQAHGELL